MKQQIHRQTYFDEVTFLNLNRGIESAVAAGNYTSGEHYWWTRGRHDGLLPQFLAPAPASESKPLISIVMPTFNAGDFITAAVDSIINQTEQNFELIIVDDGSTDATGQALWALSMRDPRVRILWKSNGGTGSALNMGFRYCSGLYQTWFSADNLMHAEALAELSLALDEHPAAVMAYADFLIQDERSGAIQIFGGCDFDRNRLRRFCYIGNTWLFRRSVKLQAGEYLEDLCEDYDMHLRMAALGDFIRVPRALGTWRRHTNNLTSSICEPSGWAHSARIQASHQWRKARVKIAHVNSTRNNDSSGWHLMQAVAQISDDCGMRRISASGGRENPGIDLETSASITTDILADTSLIHLNVSAAECNNQAAEFAPWNKLDLPMILHVHGVVDEIGAHFIAQSSRSFTAPILYSHPGSAETLAGVWLPELLPIDPDPGFFDASLFTPAADRDMSLHIIAATDEIGHALKCWGEERRESTAIPIFNGFLTIESATPLPYRPHLKRQQRSTIRIADPRKDYLTTADWEALAQGLVVFADLSESAREAYRLLGEGICPPVQPLGSVAALRERLIMLALNPTELRSLCDQSRAWMEQHYGAATLLQKYETIYHTAMHAPRLRDFGLTSATYASKADMHSLPNTPTVNFQLKQ